MRARVLCMYVCCAASNQRVAYLEVTQLLCLPTQVIMIWRQFHQWTYFTIQFSSYCTCAITQQLYSFWAEPDWIYFSNSYIVQCSCSVLSIIIKPFCYGYSNLCILMLQLWCGSCGKLCFSDNNGSAQFLFTSYSDHVFSEFCGWT